MAAEQVAFVHHAAFDGFKPEPASESFASTKPVARPAVAAARTFYTCHLTFEDGSALIGRADGTVTVWKTEDRSGELKESVLGAHTNSVNCIVYDPLAGTHGVPFTAAGDGSIRSWDPWIEGDKDCCLQIMMSHRSSVTDLALGGGCLASVSTDKTIQVWKPVKGREMSLYPWFEVMQIIDLGKIWPSAVTLTDSETGPTMFVGDSTGTITVYEKGMPYGAAAPIGELSTDTLGGGTRTESPNPLGESSALTSTQKSTASTAAPGSTKGPPAAAGVTMSSSYGAGAALSRTKSKFQPGLEYTESYAMRKCHSLTVTDLILLHESNHLCSLSFDCTARVSDVRSGTALIVVSNSRGIPFRSMLWNSFNQELFLSDDQGFLVIWNVFRDALIKEEILSPSSIPHMLLRRVGDIHRLSWLTGSTLTFTDVARSAQFAEFEAHADSVVALVALEQLDGSDGRLARDARLFSAGLDNRIHCWDIYDMSELFELAEKKAEISCMTYLSQPDLLVTGNDDGSMRFWNPDARSSMRFMKHKNTVTCMASVPFRGRLYLLSCDYDGTILVWDVTVRRTMQPTVLSEVPGVPADTPPGECELLCIVDHCSLPPESEACYMTGGNDYLIRIRSIVNHAQIGVLDGHTEAVTCLARYENTLLSGSEDASIRMWDVTTPSAATPLRVLEEAHGGTIRDLVNLPGFPAVVSCGYDGKIRIWDHSTSDPDTGAGMALKTEWTHTNQLRRLAVCSNQVFVGTEERRLLCYPLPEALVVQQANPDEAAAPPAPAVVAGAEAGSAGAKAEPEAAAGAGGGVEAKDGDGGEEGAVGDHEAKDDVEDDDFWARRDSWSGAAVSSLGMTGSTATGRPGHMSGLLRASMRYTAPPILTEPEDPEKVRQKALTQAANHMKVVDDSVIGRK